MPKKAGLEYLCFGQMIKANVGNIVLRVSKASSDSIMLKCMRKQVGGWCWKFFLGKFLVGRKGGNGDMSTLTLAPLEN